MSGGSQHNPNGRQAQLGAGWSPLQVANFLSRAPQAHMASERGVTWHTPTPPPPHLYHVPAPSPPDPLQAMKSVGSNSVFRHTATPPDLYRHTPTPPDNKLLLRHTPSPSDVKTTPPIPPADLYPHLGPGRDKLVRPEELYARGGGAAGVDLSLGTRSANGVPSPALSVRDAPTINSLIARAQPRHPHAKFDAILERLVPSPVSPHSVIVHSRAAPTPSPPSSNEDSADSCGAPPGSKRKRKPDRILRVPSAPGTPNPPTTPTPPIIPPNLVPTAAPTPSVSRITPPPESVPIENGETSHQKQNGPDPDIVKPPSPQPTEPHARRKTRSGSAETIDDIAAMIASTNKKEDLETPLDIPEKMIEGESEADAPVTIDKLKSVLASPESTKPECDIKKSPIKTEEMDKQIEIPVVETATAPKRRSTRTSNSESTNVPVESPSEAKPAEPEVSEAEPVAASFVEVENQLEKMFAGIEEVPLVNNNNGETETPANEKPQASKTRKRRKSVAAKGERKPSRRSSRASVTEESPKKKPGRKKPDAGKIKKGTKEANGKDAYDSGSNASSSRSRGPYIQIRGPGDSPHTVSVINASTGDEEGDTGMRRKGDDFRNGMRVRGMHASTLGLRYDATTADATWLCAFCERGPHAGTLGDLFGPYTIHTDCDEYRALDEATKRRYESRSTSSEVWFHETCAVWAPGLVAAGARMWGLAGAVWAARGARCGACGRSGAGLACSERACRARTHVPCASLACWKLKEDEFRAVCPRHA